MEEYLKQILKHLPIRFADNEANEFVKYLSETYLENLENEKYQFSFKAFHMLYMTFIYKIGLLRNISTSANDIFDYSDLIPKESDMITAVLKNTAFRKNDLKKCLFHVDARNHCSHASGKIEYDKIGVNHLIRDELKYIERLQQKIKPELKVLLQNFLEENWQQSFLPGDFKNFFEDNYLSLKDLELISQVSLLLFRKKSNNEENIRQKILYLLLIFEIQNQVDNGENLFLEKLPILMINLPKKIKIGKDGNEDEIYTSEIIEEFLMPIIGGFLDKDRLMSEEILNLGEE